MKPVFNKALAVGVLVAVAGVAFLLAFTFFRTGGYSERDSYVVYARFSDATGLTWKSRVQIAGIQIGEVSRISLDRSRALLEMRISKDVQLHVDACLYKTFPSALLPDALLEAAPGSEEKPLLSSLPQDQRVITCVREATSVQQLMDAMAKIATDVQVVTGDLAATVSGDEGSLRDIVENLARITRQVEQVVSTNGQTLSEVLQNTRDFTGDLREIASRDKARIHSIIRNIDQLTAQLNVAAASVQEILSGEDVAVPARPGAARPGATGANGARADGGAGAPGRAGARGEDGAPGVAGAVVSGGSGTPGGVRPDLRARPDLRLVEELPPPSAPEALAESGAAGLSPAQAQGRGVQQAVARLNDSLARLDAVMAKVEEGKSVAGRLLTDERMGRQLGTAVEGVSEYVDRLQRMQIELELRSEWLLNQTLEEGRPGAKIYFSARLIPRPDKYYLVEIVSDPRGVDTVTTETITTRAPGSTTDSTTIVTRQLHEEKLTFSLQLAKRYGLATFRMGVIESSGGVGADLHLLDDQLQLSISMYQFSRVSRDVYPRAKVWLNYHFLQHFFVTTGVDDFLNRWQSATSVGGRRFNVGTDVFFGVGLYFTDDDIKTLLLSGAGSVASAGQ